MRDQIAITISRRYWEETNNEISDASKKSVGIRTGIVLRKIIQSRRITIVFTVLECHGHFSRIESAVLFKSVRFSGNAADVTETKSQGFRGLWADSSVEFRRGTSLVVESGEDGSGDRFAFARIESRSVQAEFQSMLFIAERKPRGGDT